MPLGSRDADPARGIPTNGSRQVGIAGREDSEFATSKFDAHIISDPHRPTIGGLITGSYCFWGFASRKSFTIGTIVDMRAISVTCVVSGKMANLEAERGCMSP